MKIYEDPSATYPDAIDHYHNFKEFCTEDKEVAFFAGWAYMDNYRSHQSEIEKYQTTAFFNTEHPCVFQGTDENMTALSADSNKIFNKIYTHCPYTADWLNEKESDNRFQNIYVPFNKKYMTEKLEEKQFDALYWGGMHNIHHKDIIDSIKDYKYNFLTVGPQTWSLWWSKERWAGFQGPFPQPDLYASYITGVNVKRELMWELLRKTKVNVMSNLLYTDENINNNIRKHDQWEKNKAFSHLDQFIMPQIKTRPVETAANKCLMVVKRDPWNIQENFFEPDKEFIYYNNKKELQYILEDVKINWKSYEPIVENAYQKVMNNYTTKHFIEKVEKTINDK